MKRLQFLSCVIATIFPLVSSPARSDHAYLIISQTYYMWYALGGPQSSLGQCFTARQRRQPLTGAIKCVDSYSGRMYNVKPPDKGR